MAAQERTRLLSLMRRPQLADTSFDLMSRMRRFTAYVVRVGWDSSLLHSRDDDNPITMLIHDHWYNSDTVGGRIEYLLRETRSPMSFDGLKSPLTDVVSEWSENAKRRLLSSSVVGTEQNVAEQRLTSLEDRIGRMERQLRHRSTDTGVNQENTDARGRSDLLVREQPAMNSTMVNLISIAAAVDSYPLDKDPAWDDIAERFPGAKIFALDSNPLSFVVLEHGHFDGRTNILLSVPQTMRSGRQIESSVTIPAIVHGKLSTTGEIEISYFKLSGLTH